MQQYLKQFATHSAYEAVKNNLDKPNVIMCLQEDEVHYNPWVETRLVAIFNITNTANATSIINSHTSQFSEIEIDGVIQPSVVDSYRFSTTGEHIVKYTLVDNSCIESSSFVECRQLISMTIPNSVISIGDNAFYSCSSMTSVIIPNSVTTVGDSAFRSCSSLTSVTIPNSVTTIGDSAFAGCSGLTSITIPNNVTSIGSSAFSGCSGITSVTIPNSVTSIGSWAFLGCNGLTSVTIGNSVTSIGERAFYECNSLTSIKVESGNTIYDSRNDCNALIETASNTLIVGCNNTVIPNSVTSIGNSAFYRCSGLTSVTIPNSVTNIENSAFRYCSSLTSVIIPSSMTSIGTYAFADCSGLTSITSLAVTAPTIQNSTFLRIKTGGILTVSTGSSGYNKWMGTGNYYLGKYNWTKVEQ